MQLAVRHELTQPRRGLVARAAGREAEVELRRGERGDDVLRDSAFDAHRAQHLAVDELVELDLERLEVCERCETLREQVDRVAARPRPCRVRALAVELDS